MKYTILIQVFLFGLCVVCEADSVVWNGRIIYSDSGMPAAGIIVSNEQTAVATDVQGRFSLEKHSTQAFLWMSTPSGYQSEGDYFRRIADLDSKEEVLFRLVRAPEREEGPFRFAHGTDSHFGDDSGRFFTTHADGALPATQSRKMKTHLVQGCDGGQAERRVRLVPKSRGQAEIASPPRA